MTCKQLHPMAMQGKAAVGADQVTVVADTGYSNGEHGALCETGPGITAIVPRAETVNPQGKQYFSRERFPLTIPQATAEALSGW